MKEASAVLRDGTVRRIGLIPVQELEAGDRKGIIGGSDIGAILGLPGYGTALKAARQFLGVKEEPDDDLKWTFERGHILEGANAEMFASRMGVEVAESAYAFCDPDRPYLICHPDRLIRDRIDGLRCALECKMCNSHAARGGGWGEPGTDQVPPQYLAQCHWYCAMGVCERVYLSRLTDNDITVYVIDSDPELEKAMADKAAEFAAKVRGGWLPGPADSAEARSLFPASCPDSVTADAETAELAEKAGACKERIKDAEQELDGILARIQMFMGGNELLLDGEGARIATWKQVSSSRCDTARLKKEKPEVFEAYQKTIETRPFKLL